MNRKIKKAAAVLASAVLCLSMGMSVFAAESQTDPVIPDTEDQIGAETPEDKGIFWTYSSYGEDEDGKMLTVNSYKISQEVEEVLKDEEAVKNILKDAGYEVTDDHQVVVLGAGDYEVVGDASGAIDMTFDIGMSIDSNWDDLKDLKNGDRIYVLHQTAEGTWEVLEGEAVVDDMGYVTVVSVDVTMTGFSPIAFIKVMSNGEVVILDKNEVPTQKVEPTDAKTTTVTVKKSPKTGE